MGALLFRESKLNLRGKPRPTKASWSMLLMMMAVMMIKNRNEVGGGDME